MESEPEEGRASWTGVRNEVCCRAHFLCFWFMEGMYVAKRNLSHKVCPIGSDASVGRGKVPLSGPRKAEKAVRLPVRRLWTEQIV